MKRILSATAFPEVKPDHREIANVIHI